MQLQSTTTTPSFLTAEAAIRILQNECALQHTQFAEETLAQISDDYRPFADWNGDESQPCAPCAPFQYVDMRDSINATMGALHCSAYDVRHDPVTQTLQRRVPSCFATGVNITSDVLLASCTSITVYAMSLLGSAAAPLALAVCLPAIIGGDVLCLSARSIALSQIETRREQTAIENATKKFKETIAKIRNTITQLESFHKNEPLQVVLSIYSNLQNATLTEDTRRNLIGTMSIVQLYDVLTSLGRAAFDEGYKPFLKEAQKSALVFLEALRTSNTIFLPDLTHIQRTLEQDELFFKHVVYTLPENTFQDARVQKIISQAHTHHLSLQASESVEEIRKQGRVQVQCTAQSTTKACNVFVAKEILLQYDYFKVLFSGDFRETHPNSVTLTMTDDEFDVFQDLLEYMKTKTLNTSNVVSLLYLADRFGIKDCLMACKQRLVVALDQQSPPYKYNDLHVLIQSLCPHHQHLMEDLIYSLLVRDEISPQKLEALLKIATENKFLSTLQKFDLFLSSHPLSLDTPFMTTVFSFALPRTQSSLTGLVEGEIARKSTDFTFLLFFKNYHPAEYMRIQQKYLTHLPDTHIGEGFKFANMYDLPELKQALSTHLNAKISSQNFRSIWDVANRWGVVEVKKACLDFFDKCPDKQKLINQWHWGNEVVPVEILSACFARMELADLQATKPCV